MVTRKSVGLSRRRGDPRLTTEEGAFTNAGATGIAHAVLGDVSGGGAGGIEAGDHFAAGVQHLGLGVGGQPAQREAAEPGAIRIG